LPIEIKALEEVKAKSQDGEVKLDAIGVRRAARNLASKTVKKQMKGFKKWAVMADWENLWRTMDKGFELKQLGVFLEMTKQNLIFRRNKPVYWSPSSKSALAEAELEYNENHESTAAYVIFKTADISEALKQKGVDASKLHATIWTTTPWTLPANRAIAIHTDLDYTIVENNNEQLIIAQSRLADVVKQCELEDYKIIVDDVKGSELEGATYYNLLDSSAAPQPIIAAAFVSADSGTGLVHCAPGHGMEDYDVCTKLGIAAFAPVDDAGCFTSEASFEHADVLEGLPVTPEGNKAVLGLLGSKILNAHAYKHKYPYDWRTKKPVIVRATEQWFADVGILKERALKALQDVQFTPATGLSRLSSFVNGRSEWCISRQRAWGVPIPALYDKSGKALLTEQSVSHIMSVIEERGIDAWWTDAETDESWVHPDLRALGPFRRGRDTMDVWFDSGSSWTQTEGQADVYSEGSDQHRGWFQSSLLTWLSASGENTAPFKKCITHGFTLDQEGKKMSKSIGNVISPTEIMEGTLLPPMKKKGKAQPNAAPKFDGLGADALRLWVAGSDYTRDVVLGVPVFKTVHSSLLKYRTMIKMLLGSMHPSTTSEPLSKLDTIALYQLRQSLNAVEEAYAAYDFHKAVTIINKYVNNDLSAFYLEAMKDRLYCGASNGVLRPIFLGLLHMLGPITPVLVEESWAHAPEWLTADVGLHPLHRSNKEVDFCPSAFAPELPTEIQHLMSLNAAVKIAQEEARGAKLIGSSLQSSVIIDAPAEAQALFKSYASDLEDLLVVSSATFGSVSDYAGAEWSFSAEFDAPGGKGTVLVLPPNAAKCPRCWRYVAPVEDALCGRCADVVGEHTH
jgi:isoleucyl-tRNA synthetase